MTMKNSREIYRVHPSVAYARKIIANLPDKTGRSLDDWSDLLRAEGPKEKKERPAWLHSEYGLGRTTAWLIASAAQGSSPEDYDDDRYLDMAVNYVENLYSGKKEHLRPIHEALLRAGYDLGDDVAASPCTTMVPLYKNRVIAQIKPTTLTRIDLGLALKDCDEAYSDRLVDTGGLRKGDRITHRIPISSVEEIDDEVKYWLNVAYELDN